MLKKGVVITDKHAISYGLIRYIANYKLPIVLIYFDDLSICRLSKFVCKSIKLNYLDKKSLINQLISISKKYDFSNYLLIPCDDEKLMYFSKYKEELSNYYIPLCSDWETVRKFIDKVMTYRLCEKLKINYPKLYTEYNNITDILDEIIYPVILKPNEMYPFFKKYNKKAILCGDREELIKNYSKYLMSNYTLMVQEYIEGNTDVLYSYAGFAINGKILDGITVHRSRQHPMRFGAASTFVVVKNIPKLKKIGAILMENTKYSGPFEVEFMYDEKVRAFKLLEVNARFWGWHTILSVSGHDIIGKMIEYYLGEINYKNNINDKDYKKCWVHLLTDIFTIFKEGLKGNLNVNDSIKSLNNCECGIFNKEDLFLFFWEIITSPIRMLKGRN